MDERSDRRRRETPTPSTIGGQDVFNTTKSSDSTGSQIQERLSLLALNMDTGSSEAKSRKANLSQPVPGSSFVTVDSHDRLLGEIERIKSQLLQYQDEINNQGANGCPTTKNKSSSSVPTDLTISDLSPASDCNPTTTYHKCDKLFLDHSCGEMETVKRDIRNDYGLATTVTEREQRGPLAANGNVKKMSRIRAVFDNIPAPKLSINDIKHELSENRFQSHKVICQLNAEVAMKSKESEFLETQLARSHTDLRVARSEIASKDVEIKELRKAMIDQEDKYSKRILELTLELQSKSAKLESFEKLYSDMDQLASVDSVEPDPFSKVDNINAMLSRAPGVPSVFRFKLLQSIDLTQRLQEERDHLGRCRDEADRLKKEAETKYHGVLIELNKLKIGEDTRLCSLKASLQIKTFELERVSLILDEYQQKFRIATNEIRDLKLDMKLLNDELHENKLHLSGEITRLQLEMQSKTSKLELYESIEDALDDMVVKAAAVPDKDIGKRLLSFCSSGPSLPTDARRRLQQAFDLAKKNCELQKMVTEQKVEILALYDERQMLRQENQTVRSLNGYSVGQLIDTITKKTREIGKLNQQIESMGREISEMKKTKEILEQTVGNLKSYNEQVLTLYHSGARVNQAKQDQLTPNGILRESVDQPTDSELVMMKSSYRLRNSTTENDYSGDGTLSVIPSLKTSREGKSTGSYSFGDSVASCFTGDGSMRRILEPTEMKKSELSTITEESKKHLEYDFDDSSVVLESPSSFSGSTIGPPPAGIAYKKAYSADLLSPPQPLPPRSSSSPLVHNKSGRLLHSYEMLALKNNRDRGRSVALRLSKVVPKRRPKSNTQF